ncbi:MAG: SusC/RagA family TonB-linked outer membrane protein [Muribaculaceae bacterium]|nr:SusC/RagA family TonB-linked outer membrane protein [Muribaculaceae bacterium]
MKKQCVLLAALAIACGAPVGMTSVDHLGFTAVAQANKVTGVVRDANGEPLIGATVKVKGTNRGTATDIDGKYSIAAAPGSTLVISYIGATTQEVVVSGATADVTLQDGNALLDEVVVTALGIKKERKSLGYAVDDLKAEELMRNKNTNAINSLAGKIAGVNITQSSGAAGSGAQIILRGGTSIAEGRDNQPLFVVDGVIYDNSTSIVGNSAFDGMTNSATTASNRVMDINPEDIESMTVLKGPAAAALYGSRASAGVVIITTKSGKAGRVEVNLGTSITTSWAHRLPKVQTKYKHGYLEDQYTNKQYTGYTYNDFAYNSWGEAITDGQTYDNIGNFFENATIWDTNLSVAGGSDTGKFFLSGSFYDQDGIVPTTGYKKTTLRFNGEQKYKLFTFGANAAYTQARTTKTLTGAALYGSSGTGALYAVYNWAPDQDMRHYLNEDGSRYRMFGDRLDADEERENPYWIVNKNKMRDHTERFTGNFNVRADFTDWWWVSFRMGVDSYTTQNENTIAAGGAIKKDWQNGMYSENELRFRYLSTNLMTNFNKQFGDFNFNLMLGTATDNTRTWTNYRRAWNFIIPELYMFNNANDNTRAFQSTKSRKRLVGVYGEFRMDWRNAIFLTVTGRNDWDSTLPTANWSYFYPSVSGAIAFTELMGESRPDWLSFGKVRASWARVGKGTNAYATTTALWPVGEFIGGLTGSGNSWEQGNPTLKPEMTNSTEVGLELRFLQNRLKFDAAYYHNKTTDQIIVPRVAQSTGYILKAVNAGTVTNQGLEFSIGGTPIQNENFTWEINLNAAGNRGRVKDLPDGIDYLYLTDVQYGSAKAASVNNGTFMAIIGNRWLRVNDPESEYNGQLILDANGMPRQDNTGNGIFEVGNREPKFTGGLNNTLTYKNFTFNMLWEFRVGGDVFNGTKYVMSNSGVSKWSLNRDDVLTISGVRANGDGYEPVTNTFEPGKSYVISGTEMSGENVIKSYYTGYYNYETANWITKVNSLRLRTISLSYALPKALLEKTRFIKAASVSATASNLLLFTNYDGDPEVAASGSGVGGSSSVGFDYLGVPSTASFTFGVNLTF